VTDTALGPDRGLDFHEPMSANTPTALEAPVEMVGIHLVARAEVGKLTMEKKPLGDADASPAQGHAHGRLRAGGQARGGRSTTAKS
jgi:N-methylhydantoinase A